MSLVHMGLIVYVHSISKDPLRSCRAWKLCPKSCLSKIVKYRALILNHSCRMSDHVFRREHSIIMITANHVNGRVQDPVCFQEGIEKHDKALYVMPVQNTVCISCKSVLPFFRGIGIQACYISFALLKTGAVTFAN